MAQLSNLPLIKFTFHKAKGSLKFTIMNVARQLPSYNFWKFFLLFAGFVILIVCAAINFVDSRVLTGLVEKVTEARIIDDGNFECPSFEKLMKGPFTLEHDDPRLIEIIRKKYLHPPPGVPYNLTNPQNVDPQLGNNQEIRKILNDKKNGFFIECGAFTGEFYSNSIFYERFREWTGILIEPVPEFYDTLVSKRRNSWTAQVCLSADTFPSEVSFQVNGWGSAIASYSKQSDKSVLITVQCFPLYSILLALNVTKIDYFILDVEAAEFQVLKTIPWDKVNITTIMVEVQFISDKKDLVEYMAKCGYKLHNNITDFNAHAMDYTFYHPLLIS